MPNLNRSVPATFCLTARGLIHVCSVSLNVTCLTAVYVPTRILSKRSGGPDAIYEGLTVSLVSVGTEYSQLNDIPSPGVINTFSEGYSFSRGFFRCFFCILRSAGITSYHTIFILYTRITGPVGGAHAREPNLSRESLRFRLRGLATSGPGSKPTKAVGRASEPGGAAGVCRVLLVRRLLRRAQVVTAGVGAVLCSCSASLVDPWLLLGWFFV